MSAGSSKRKKNIKGTPKGGSPSPTDKLNPSKPNNFLPKAIFSLVNENQTKSNTPPNKDDESAARNENKTNHDKHKHLLSTHLRDWTESLLVGIE